MSITFRSTRLLYVTTVILKSCTLQALGQCGTNTKQRRCFICLSSLFGSQWSCNRFEIPVRCRNKGVLREIKTTKNICNLCFTLIEKEFYADLLHRRLQTNWELYLSPYHGYLSSDVLIQITWSRHSKAVSVPFRSHRGTESPRFRTLASLNKTVALTSFHTHNNLNPTSLVLRGK